MANAKEQMAIIHCWFESWGQSERNRFCYALQSRVQSGGMCDILGGFQFFMIDHGSSSVFDCQLRLFRTWFEQWTANDRVLFVDSIGSKDKSVAVEEIREEQNKLNSSVNS